jgi:hypothetical protein
VDAERWNGHNGTQRLLPIANSWVVELRPVTSILGDVGHFNCWADDTTHYTHCERKSANSRWPIRRLLGPRVQLRYPRRRYSRCAEEP